MRYTEINEGSMERQYNGNRRQPMEIQAAFEFVRDNCSSAYDTDPIYRGAKSRGVGDGPMFVDTMTGSKRESANTKSYVGILMDNLPSWKDYPKRSRSLICTNDPSYAANYGSIYRVFPVNGTKVGVCQDSDLWYSFGKFRSVPNFNAALDFLSEKLLDAPLSENPAEFFKQIDLITEHLDQIGGFGSVSNNNILKNLVSVSNELKTNDMKTILAALTEPRINGFILTTVENLSLPGNNEVWLAGKAVLIPMGMMSKLDEFMKAE